MPQASRILIGVEALALSSDRNCTVYRTAMAVFTTNAAFHRQMFGCAGRFPTHHSEGDWLIFQTSERRQPSVFHGCCLSQLHQILSSSVWRAGLWQPPSSTSPMGIYIANTPSAALDRAPLQSGYAQSLHTKSHS